jgi:hypothetical protein
LKRGAGGPGIARPLLLLLLAIPARASHWEDPQWRRLLHYKKSLTGRWVGDAREGLYLAPSGRRDPKAEYEASVAALGTPEECDYPARSAWLREKLGKPPAPPCGRFADWRALLDARGVTLVFASAYMNNPSSMFGHTFLRLERAGVGEEARLRDNTLNFAGETGPDNGVLFAVKGLMGLYPGRYTAVPYFLKAAEYGNIEARDLWEYRLALSSAEVDGLAAHAWEVGRSTFPYLFLSKNCSYQLMPFLEAAAPRLSLMEGSPPVVAPADTLRAVVESPGLVSAVQYRPAHATQMRQRRALLTRAERRAAEAYASSRTDEGDGRMEGWDSSRRALVLDAAHDYVLYKKGFSPDVPDDVRRLERSILVRRAKVPDLPVDLSPPAWAARPDEGHRRRRPMLGAGVRRDGGGYGEFAWRPGYHDLVDDAHGYTPGAAIEAASWRLRYDGAERRVHLHDMRFIEIVSVAPFDPWMKKPSWTVGTGLETGYELGKTLSSSLLYEGHAGSGLAFEPLPGLIAYGLTQAEGAAGAALRDGYRVGGALRGGLAWRLRPVTVHVDGALAGAAWGDRTPPHRVRAAVNWSLARDAALRLEGLVRGGHREGGLHAAFYY